MLALVGLAGAIVSAAVGIYVAKRQRSGKIDTTEAEKLWDEGTAMRRELRDEVLSVRAENLLLREEQKTMRQELVQLRAETAVLRAELAALQSATSKLQADGAELRERFPLNPPEAL